jgi:hypothetical protein
MDKPNGKSTRQTSNTVNNKNPSSIISFQSKAKETSSHIYWKHRERHNPLVLLTVQRIEIPCPTKYYSQGKSIIRVDFPDPFGPRMTEEHPWAIIDERSWKTG